MKFEWDPGKRAANPLKHGLDFRNANEVFRSIHFTCLDAQMDYGEERYITIGIQNGRLVVLVHTIRSGRYRIISMRKANERETKDYQK